MHQQFLVSLLVKTLPLLKICVLFAHSKGVGTELQSQHSAGEGAGC